VEVRLLGSGGFTPSDRRETACALVRKGDDGLLIDAGTGARRLLTDRSLLDGVARLHVVLTHFHLDHMGGLFYLVDADRPLTVWGGGQLLEGIATRSLVERLLGSPFAPESFLEDFGDVRELSEGENGVGSFSVRARVQALHSNPTLALRIDDAIVWCTDTQYDAGNVDFARGARVLFHDSFTAGGSRHHTAAREAAELAAAAEVERLVLIHLDPTVDADDAFLAAAEPIFPAVEVAHDGLVVAP
jgi:ribonuclease BN (tRNA processing enzyme)